MKHCLSFLHVKSAPACIKFILSPYIGTHESQNPSKSPRRKLIFVEVMEGEIKIKKVVFLVNGLTDFDYVL